MNAATETAMNRPGGSAWAAKQETVPTGSTGKVVDLQLPSGFVCKARRPNLSIWYATGRIPQPLLTALIEAALEGTVAEVDSKSIATTTNEPEGEDAFAWAKAMRDVVTATVVWPRIVAHATNEDEISASDIPGADFGYLLMWALIGAPDVPVATKGGDVALADIKTFPDGQQDPAVSGNSDDSANVSSASE